MVELNTKHGLEVWINQKLVEEIENAFKKLLKTEDLNYYYIPCTCENKNKTGSNTKWVGNISLIDFIKKIQKLNHHFCPIGVTNAQNKKDLEFYFNKEFHSLEPKHWDYWIGDVVGAEMATGDELFIVLWNRVKNQVTKNSKTRKKYFFEK